jgi:CheY-like chemotaxis protein
LIVEDNKINQMIAKKMLENKDVFCEIIDNGEEAIEAIKSNQRHGINGCALTRHQWHNRNLKIRNSILKYP